jgi:undecaprenyl diphosphate synthase
MESLPLSNLEDTSLVEVDRERVPRHVAIIMDGNRRWAKQRGLPTYAGHLKGAENLTKIVRAASRLGIKVLTVYTFSTETWRRSSEEIAWLMQIFKHFLIQQRKQMIDEGVKLGAIGDLTRLPQSVRDVFEETKAATAGGDQIELVLALSYGGRDDIRRAFVSIIADCERGLIDKSQLSEQLISGYLDTAPWGDPQLLVRTSGERRLSNFLLWQVSYSEVYITEMLWPEFDEQELLRAVLDYQTRERRFGG